MQGVTFCNSGISGKIHVWTWPKLHTHREYHGQQCMTRKCHQFPLEGPKIGPQNQHFFQTKICKKLRLACCYALHVKWLRLACCGRRRGELVLLGYSQRCSSPRKYTNTQIHKNNIRHKHSLVQIVAKSYALHVKLNLASKPNFLKDSDARTSKECFYVSDTKIHKYTSTQIHHTTQIHHKTQIQLGSNHLKKLRYKKFLKD